MCLKDRRIIRGIIWVFFIIYLSGLIYFLFFSERYGRQAADSYRYNLTPFAEIKRYLRYYDTIGIELFLLNIVGNVVAFIPFGFCTPILGSNNKGFFRVLLSGVIFTVSIELVQLLTHVGSFDVDDMILNTVGVIIGYLIYVIVRCMYRHIRGRIVDEQRKSI